MFPEMLNLYESVWVCSLDWLTAFHFAFPVRPGWAPRHSLTQRVMSLMSWCVGNRKRDKHMINVLMWWVSANFLSCSRTSWNFSSLRWSFWGHLNSVYFCEGFLQLAQYQEQANSDWVVSGVTSNSSIAQLWLDWLHFGWLMLFHAFPIFPYLSLISRQLSLASSPSSLRFVWRIRQQT